MSETTSSSAEPTPVIPPSLANIGKYYLDLWEYSRSPGLESESEDFMSEELPTELDTVNSSGGFSVVGPDKLSVSYPNVNLHGHDVGVVQANRPAPSKRFLYYFEMTVKNAGTKGQVSIGFTTSDFRLRRQPGWEMNSCGYHGDDGMFYHGHGKGEKFGPTYTTGDTVGGGINYAEQKFFFTKNGKVIGSAEKDIKGKIFPTVAVHSQYEEVNVNFGQKPFVFDLDAYEADQRVQQQMKIDDISISEDVIYRLVREYLQHYGYGGTLDALDEAGKITTPPVLFPQTSFDENKTSYELKWRTSLRQKIRDGKIDAVISNLQKQYPLILQAEKSPVCCLLYCQKFIELVREGKLEEAVQYGRTEFVKFNSTSERELITDCAALLAYEHPDTSPVGYLLKESQRELLADAVNAVVLSGDEYNTVSSKLEIMIRQLATCVLEKRRTNGDEGEGFHLHRIINSGKKD